MSEAAPPAPTGHRWAKGQSGNPSGRAPTPEDIRRAKQLTANEFSRIVNRFFFMKPDALTDYLNNGNANNLEKIVGNVVYKAAVEGDIQRATFLLDRTIGKVMTQIEVTIPKPTIITKLDGTQMVLGHEEQTAIIDAEVTRDE